MNQQSCPRCGMPHNEWKANQGQGYQREGQTYCCAGCANNTGCTCRQ